MSVTLGPYIAYYNSVITDYIKSAMQQRVWILHELLQKGGHICHVGNLLCYWRCCSHNWQFVDLLLDMHVMVTALTCCCVMKVDDTGARWSSFILSNFSSVLVMTVGLLLLLVFLCSSCFSGAAVISWCHCSWCKPKWCELPVNSYLCCISRLCVLDIPLTDMGFEIKTFKWHRLLVEQNH